jgi:hypothetical protein
VLSGLYSNLLNIGYAIAGKLFGQTSFSARLLLGSSWVAPRSFISCYSSNTHFLLAGARVRNFAGLALEL